jgi:hypothetical protein
VTGDIGQRRCFHHSGREAVGRCTVCRRDFCAECVTDHDDRLVCAHCLAGFAARPPEGRGGLKRVGAAVGTAFLLLAGWCLFFVVLRTVAVLPVAVHDSAAGGEAAVVGESP